MNMETTGITGMTTTAMTMVMNMGTTTMNMGTVSTSMDMDMSTSATTMAATSTGMAMNGMNMASSTMSMASSTATKTGTTVSCTMSMLWNWYSKDVCFIARSWRTHTKGIFAGTCIGVFGLLLAINWWRRLLSQYKIYCAELRDEEVKTYILAGGEITKRSTSNSRLTPFFQTLKHDWLWRLDRNLCVEVDDKVYIYPSVFEHVLYCMGDTIEWSVHHCIMLLFMYFNGYVFISCMIGAGIGFLLFQNKPLNKASGGEKVSKRCCL